MPRCKKCGGMRGAAGPGLPAVVGDRQVIALDLARLTNFHNGLGGDLGANQLATLRRMARTALGFIENNIERFQHYRDLNPQLFEQAKDDWNAIRDGPFDSHNVERLLRVIIIAADY